MVAITQVRGVDWILAFNLYAFTDMKNAGHEMAIVGEPCNANAHAKIPALFISMLCPCCVDTYTVQLYTLTVTVQLSH